MICFTLHCMEPRWNPAFNSRIIICEQLVQRLVIRRLEKSESVSCEEQSTTSVPPTPPLSLQSAPPHRASDLQEPLTQRHGSLLSLFSSLGQLPRCVAYMT